MPVCIWYHAAMHPLQAHILAALIRRGSARYAELKPDEVEGNLFSYHLRCTLKAGLVCHGDDALYRLTDKGCYYADGLSLKTMTPREQPRIFTLLAIEGPDGQWLLYRRRREPMMGLVGFPAGKFHPDETVAQNARRELLEKTGLSGVALTHRGDGYVRIHRRSQTISHILFHLFHGRVDSLPELTGPAEGEPFWGRPEDLPQDELFISMTDLLELVRSNGERFFAELDYDLGPEASATPTDSAKTAR